MWDITIHPFGASVLAGTISFLQSMWDRPQIHPSLGPSILTGTPPRVYPFWEIARRLAHHPMSGFDTIYNGQIHRLQILSSLDFSVGFPFRASPQDFNTRWIGEGFYTMVVCSPLGHHKIR